MPDDNLMVCNYCGAVGAAAHQKYSDICWECATLLNRYRSAAAKGRYKNQVRVGKQLLERGRSASAVYRPLYAKIKEEITMIEEQLNNNNVSTDDTGAPQIDLKPCSDPCDKPEGTCSDPEPQYKVCKQCGRKLRVDTSFRKYVPRGRGIYATTQGYHTLCKDCESISIRAANAIKCNDEEIMNKLREYYKILDSRGLPPVTKPARILLGVEADRPSAKLDALLSRMLGEDPDESELDRHCRLVRERGYASFDEADAVHRTMTDKLKAAGLYEEINNLMDEWFDEED